MATVTHTVVKGDTLSNIARKYETTVDAIVKLNDLDLSNENLIYVGQVLYISGKPSTITTPTMSMTTTTNGNNCTIIAFGLQSNTNNTLFAIWTWEKANTDNFQVEWEYYTANGQWFVGSHSTVSYETSAMHGYRFNSTYSVPDNALTVRFRVKPISKTYNNDDQTVSYWTAAWTGFQTYNTRDLNPPTPSTPSVKIDGYTLTCRVDNINGLSESGSEPYVEFHIIKNDNEQFYLGLSRIIYSSASYSCSIDPGYTYRVRARVKQGESYSAWSSYSSSASSVPSAPGSITYCAAASSTSVILKWNNVASAESYSIEYSTNKDYLEGSNATTTIDSITTTQYTITGLSSGETYYFRVRSNNGSGSSSWSPIASTAIGTLPIAPTTWSSVNTATVGEPLKFYWVHNSEDGSKETRAELILNIDGVTFTRHINNTSTEDEVTTSQYDFDTSSLVEGATIKWKVRTAGVTGVLGEWSAERTVNVYAKPSLSVVLLDYRGVAINVLRTFPFYIAVDAGPATQTPVSFHVTITSNDSYETVDEIGNFKMVIAGDTVYSRFFDTNEDLLLEMLPSSVDLQANISYNVTVTVAMDSGLSAEMTTPFTVAWTEQRLVPNAEIFVDTERAIAHIRPYCMYTPILYYKVVYRNKQYVRTDTVLEPMDGISVDNAFTPTGDVVYVGYDSSNKMTHFCVVQSKENAYVPNVKLAVYRREFDGSFTEIGSGLVNEANTFVTDPHPALDYARYRVVVTSTETGAVSYNDLPGHYVGEKAVILQWNETWGDYVMGDDGMIRETLWAGSMLRLPYNIDVSESNEPEVTLVEYIGRTNPVSYYGTQVGSTATWSVVIPKKDVNTLNALRKLALWMGDVYVREPSGSGYWAHLTVSFKQTHREMTIPVTINITRVSGGV